MYKGVGRWEEFGVVVREGGQPEAGFIFHYNTGNSAVSSISEKINRYNPQDMPRWLLVAVWLNMHP